VFLLVDDGHSQLYSQENPNPSDRILMIYYKLATAAMRSGISLKIHLYEADYNLLLEMIWARRLIRHAHDEDRLNDGQSES
jgi:hypothetical protein